MRFVGTMGLLGLLLGAGISSVPRVTVSSPPPIVVPTVEDLSGIDTSPKRVYARVRIDSAVETIYAPHQRKIEQLADAWLYPQAQVHLSEATGTYFPQPPLATNIRVLSRGSFADVLEGDNLDREHANTWRGYAQVRLQTGNIRVSGRDVSGIEDCPSRFVVIMAALRLHEYLHTVGLYHPEDVPGTQIPASYRGLPNIMVRGFLRHIPASNPLTTENPICSVPVQELAPEHLGVAPLSPVQKLQLHDALNRGMTWQLLEQFDFDLGSYVKFVKESLAARNARPPAPSDHLPGHMPRVFTESRELLLHRNR